MPKSRVRKKKTAPAYAKPATAAAVTKKRKANRLVGPMVLALLGFGVLWLVVAYLSGGQAPVQENLGDWNVLVGFGFIATGFALATQWR